MSTTASTISVKPAVIYDGECSFCRARMANLRTLDKKQQFEYLPRQLDGIEDRFPSIAGIDLEDGMLFVTPDQRVSVGADAFYEIAKRLPTLWLFAWLYRVPGLTWCFKKGYAWIAANRKRLGQTCENGQCRLH